jgi:hypothetical protein
MHNRAKLNSPQGPGVAVSLARTAPGAFLNRSHLHGTLVVAVQVFHGSIEGSMKRLRALAGRVSGIRRNVQTAGPASARMPSAAREHRHAFVVWIEDHAERLILTTLVILVAVIGTLLLWKTARVISLAREFQPVLGVIAALTTISLGLLNVLKGRRDRRLRDSGNRQVAPAQASGPVIAEAAPAPAPEPEGVRGSSPFFHEDARGNSA